MTTTAKQQQQQQQQKEASNGHAAAAPSSSSSPNHNHHHNHNYQHHHSYGKATETVLTIEQQQQQHRNALLLDHKTWSSSTRQLAFGWTPTPATSKPLSDFYNNTTLTNVAKAFCAIVLLIAVFLVARRLFEPWDDHRHQGHAAMM